ncbi:MAG: hypothetical protein HC894_26440 [Microcoleus sp. SM1_3_4]|nr:hypothetical protein [Microcoleus sp. SM1_3_4]
MSCTYKNIIKAVKATQDAYSTIIMEELYYSMEKSIAIFSYKGRSPLTPISQLAGDRSFEWKGRSPLTPFSRSRDLALFVIEK